MGTRNTGFTLAEVLITLGIIGVVAAMTLPTIMNNVRNKQLEAAFKKQYSVLTSAIALIIENEYGGCSFFKKDKTDYCVGTAETKILLNEKITCIGTENEVITELYRNPNYKADEE